MRFQAPRWGLSGALSQPLAPTSPCRNKSFTRRGAARTVHRAHRNYTRKGVGEDPHLFKSAGEFRWYKFVYEIFALSNSCQGIWERVELPNRNADVPVPLMTQRHRCGGRGFFKAMSVRWGLSLPSIAATLVIALRGENECREPRSLVVRKHEDGTTQVCG